MRIKLAPIWMFFPILILLPVMAYAQAVPDDIFKLETPNVMIIFDTSSSMGRDWDGKELGWGWDRGENDVENKFFMGGGNRPASKLYQAKVAMKQVINDVIQDRVNLGFSTYAQFKTDGVFCKYLVPGLDHIRKRYFAYYQRNWDACSKGKADRFTDAMGNIQVGPGRAFQRGDTFWVNANGNPFRFFPSGWTFPANHPIAKPDGTYVWHAFENYWVSPPGNRVECVITDITINFEMNEWTFKYQSLNQYWFYDEVWKGDPISPPVCGNDYKNDPFPESDVYGYYDGCGVYIKPPGVRMYTYFANEDPRDAARVAEYNRPRRWWNCQQYQEPGWVWWPYIDGTTCPLTDPWYHYPLGPPPNKEDASGYNYPTPPSPDVMGSSNYPHMWSYFKTAGTGIWPASIQTNYYPSSTPTSPFNDEPGTGNNHYFFVNFPDDKDTTTPPITRRRAARDRILSYMDVTRVRSAKDSHGFGVDAYHTKLPLHKDFGLTGLTENTSESAFTPLADSLKWASKYFTDYICNYKPTATSPTGDLASLATGAGGVACRGNYVLLITDGLESARMKAGNVPDFDAAPNEASSLMAVNCSGSSAPVKTFVIGLGLDADGVATLDKIADKGGTTKAYSARSLDQLKTQLTTIFGMIINTYYGRSNPIATRERDRLYRGYFEITPDDEWKGFLAAWKIKPSGDLDSADPFEEAGKLLKDRSGSGRDVYTWIGSDERRKFKDNINDIFGPVNPSPEEDIDGVSGIDSTDSKKIIRFTLDPAYTDAASGRYKGKRDILDDGKGWKLGDIYHSTPIVVGPPAFQFTEHNYQNFYTTNKTRQKMIYVGANDGMLHAFNASDTDYLKEEFAVIPKNLLDDVKKLRTTHEFYVDSSPKAYDVYTGGSWKTILISGQRGGGPYYFALDVTRPTSSGYPKILWEWTESHMGDAWAKPDIGKINDGGASKFVAFITGGWSTSDDVGNSFYVVDIETGTTLKKFDKSNGKQISSTDKTNRIPSGATAFDADGDGDVDYVYFGDIKGTLWKVDVSSSDKDDWAVTQFFVPGSGTNPGVPKPIYYSPAVTKNDQGKTLVYFGTGDEKNLKTSAADINYFYEVEDQGASGVALWHQQLEDHEKVLSSPVVANYVVYFTSWVYPPTGCGPGKGRLWGLTVTKSSGLGGEAGLILLDTAGPPPVWKAAVKFVDLDSGIPSAPVVTNGKIYLSSSVDANKIKDFTIPGWGRAVVRSWREVF